MPAIKTVFILLLILMIAISVAFQCVISPILKKNHALIKKEKLLIMLQEKSDKIIDVTQHNVKYSQILRNAIQTNIALAYLQEQVNASGLFVESMKIMQVKEYDDIHMILKGNYRHLLRFLTSLAERPNGIQVRALTLKKNQIMMSIRSSKTGESITLPSRHHTMLNNMRRIETYLMPVQPPILVMLHRTLPHDVQSPFAARKNPVLALNSIQALAGYRWRCVGEVHQAGHLLGVFLKAQGKSHYFGLGLPWQDSEWIVTDIEAHTVFFKHNHSQKYWRLIYT